MLTVLIFYLRKELIVRLFCKYHIVVINIFLLFSLSEAQIINVPGDYSTIQEALDAAEEGYTVLVDLGHIRRILAGRLQMVLL